MAGDWIKIEKATVRKPEILRIAATLGIHPDHAFGLCFRFWTWCDDQLAEANVSGVSLELVDALVDRSGFAAALVTVGWLQARNGSLVIPNFDRHLSQSAKTRALTARRVSDHGKRKANGANVSLALPREEKSITTKVDNISQEDNPSSKKRKFTPPTVAEVAAYCQERRNGIDPQAWVDYWQSRGWKLRSGQMADWRAAVRTYERSDFKKTTPQSRVATKEDAANWNPHAENGGICD